MARCLSSPLLGVTSSVGREALRVGIDFGTSNNAAAIVIDGVLEVLPLDETDNFLASALYTHDIGFLPLIASSYMTQDERKKYRLSHAHELQQSQNLIREEGYEVGDEDLLLIGRSAIEQYMERPEEGYFIKSPKSFLGVTGLQQTQLDRFENITTIFLGVIKRKIDNALKTNITEVLIGRPVNFMGHNAKDSNAQAVQIITSAALKVGFRDIQFMLEPEAAGYEFARSLENETTTLVVDIGGGTSDFSMMKISNTGGAQALAHSGVRTGGNDFDIALAMKSIMPLFGLNELNVKGLPLPIRLFWDAVAINDIPAQRGFYSLATRDQITALTMETQSDSLFRKFITVWENKRSFELVRLAELGKIDLSSSITAELVVDESLSLVISREDWWLSSKLVLETIEKELNSVLESSKTTADVIYLTGGAAISPMFREKLQQWMPGIEIQAGNHLSGVVSGLAIAASRM